MGHRANAGLHRQTMQIFQDMLYGLHPAAQLYKQAFESTRNIPPNQFCRIALCFTNEQDCRRYNLPSANKLAVILPGDGDQATTSRDIVLFKPGGGIRRINDLHPLYPSLHFVLLFPTGQLSWHPDIPYRDEEIPQQPVFNDQGDKRKMVTQSEYVKYHLHPHQNESNHIFMAGELFQEYVVGCWATAEQYHLEWVRKHQTKIRADTYKGLTDALAVDPQMEANNLGQRIVGPSSFSGSSRFMIQNCQDALAINCHFRGANFFLTMTANPNWPEVKAALLPVQSPADRPDLVNCVFCPKVQELMDDIYKQGVLGRAVAHVWTTEFQKHGLPHVHLIILFHPDSKLSTPEKIDSLLSAQFADEDEQPELFELVKQFIAHTPCNGPNSDAPCLHNGKCSKNFPKPFRDHTTVNEDSYANLRRRDTGKKFQVRGEEVDNRWIAAYPPYWLWKFRCHINVECLFSVRYFKYIYKYVYKGHDCTTMEFGRCVDKVKVYLDSRYVSGCKAI